MTINVHISNKILLLIFSLSGKEFRFRLRAPFKCMGSKRNHIMFNTKTLVKYKVGCEIKTQQ